MIEYYFNMIIAGGSVIDLITFFLGFGVVAYISLQRTQIKRLKESNTELKKKYELLNGHMKTLSIILQPVVKRKLISERENGEWGTYNVLND